MDSYAISSPPPPPPPMPCSSALSFLLSTTAQLSEYLHWLNSFIYSADCPLPAAPGGLRHEAAVAALRYHLHLLQPSLPSNLLLLYLLVFRDFVGYPPQPIVCLQILYVLSELHLLLLLHMSNDASRESLLASFGPDICLSVLLPSSSSCIFPKSFFRSPSLSPDDFCFLSQLQLSPVYCPPTCSPPVVSFAAGRVVHQLVVLAALQAVLKRRPNLLSSSSTAASFCLVHLRVLLASEFSDLAHYIRILDKHLHHFHSSPKQNSKNNTHVCGKPTINDWHAENSKNSKNIDGYKNNINYENRSENHVSNINDNSQQYFFRPPLNHKMETFPHPPLSPPFMSYAIFSLTDGALDELIHSLIYSKASLLLQQASAPPSSPDLLNQSPSVLPIKSSTPVDSLYVGGVRTPAAAAAAPEASSLFALVKPTLERPSAVAGLSPTANLVAPKAEPLLPNATGVQIHSSSHAGSQAVVSPSSSGYLPSFAAPLDALSSFASSPAYYFPPSPPRCVAPAALQPQLRMDQLYVQQLSDQTEFLQWPYRLSPLTQSAPSAPPDNEVPHCSAWRPTTAPASNVRYVDTNEGGNNDGSNNHGGNNHGSNNEGGNHDGSNNHGGTNDGGNNDGSNNDGGNNDGSKNDVGGTYNDESIDGDRDFRCAVRGVYYHRRNKCWCVHWTEKGKERCKSFRVPKYGFLIAKQMAIEHRVLKELNGEASVKKISKETASAIRGVYFRPNAGHLKQGVWVSFWTEHVVLSEQQQQHGSSGGGIIATGGGVGGALSCVQDSSSKGSAVNRNSQPTQRKGTKRRFRTFSVAEFGYEGAKDRAIKCRKANQKKACHQLEEVRPPLVQGGAAREPSAWCASSHGRNGHLHRSGIDDTIMINNINIATHNNNNNNNNNNTTNNIDINNINWLECSSKLVAELEEREEPSDAVRTASLLHSSVQASKDSALVQLIGDTPLWMVSLDNKLWEQTRDEEEASFGSTATSPSRCVEEEADTGMW
eukprot:GHVS01021564.1.p1 GENE.GHVS01021564.1~~GHVS01021564.1.p1  ORF type:complete len:994 (-),score=209.79 GHVS01021564.1:615-3596(-)